MAEFTMPSLGADMDSGTLLEWLVKPGDTVTKGQIVAVVDTAKSAVDVETFTGGVVEKLLVQPGQEVPVGTPLATISAAGERATAPVSAPRGGETPAAAPATRPRVSSPLVRRLAAEQGVDLASIAGTGRGGVVTRADVLAAAPTPGAEPGPAPIPVPLPAPITARAHGTVRRPRVSPYARRLAAERGVDLSTVIGSGAHGAVRARDLDRSTTPAPPPATPPIASLPAAPPAVAAADGARAATDAPTAMRTAIARLMTRSKAEIPHYYLSTTIDLGTATAWLRDHNRSVPVSERLVPAALLLKATAVAATRHPALNGFWVDDRFEAHDAVHLGVAISLRSGGMVAPALHDAADLGAVELMAALKDLVQRARAGRLRRTELADPTITVTNLGDQGVESVLGVIYPPQVALVGFGRVIDRPWAVDGMLGIRPLVTATLSADHRATDGFTGGRFLDTIDTLLQRPEAL